MSYWYNYPEKVNKEHYLLVSVSRHIYLGADGRPKLQKKALEIGRHASKNLLLFYLVADRDSGAYYGEVTTVQDNTIRLEEFLQRAWQPGKERAFHGLPDKIVVAKKVTDEHPGIGRFITERGIELWHPASGFDGGIRMLALFEKRFFQAFSKEGFSPLWSDRFLLALFDLLAARDEGPWLVTLKRTGRPARLPPELPWVKTVHTESLDEEDGGLEEAG